MNRTLFSIVLAATVLLSTSAVQGQNTQDKSNFSIARIKWGSGNGWSFNPQWAHDWPTSEINVMHKLRQVTSIDLTVDAEVVELDDPRLYEFTFAYMCEVQRCQLSADEANGMREYLLRGGFLMVDDSWGAGGLQHFAGQLRRVLPEYTLEEITSDHPIFHSFYSIDKIPSIQGRRRMSAPKCYGITDEKGRLMVLLNWDNDIGDGWEWAVSDPYEGLKAYKLGINYILYSLSH